MSSPFASAERGRPARVLFSGHDFKFLAPLIERCRANPLFEVRLDKHKGHVIDSEDDARACVEWADIVFCEWAMGNAVWYSRNKRPGQLLVVRLHLQEVQDRDRLPYLREIDWARVDRLVLITQRIYDWMTREFPALRGRACLVYNPIDACGALDRPKLPGAEFNLGIVGIVPMRKRFDLAVEVWEKLAARDPRFRLFIKGSRPEDYPWMLRRAEEMAWYRAVYDRIDKLALRENVVFDPPGADMPEWYSKIGFLLSTSDFEGSHQAVAEAMAGGSVPLIRDWDGADRIYPPKHVVRTTDEAAERAMALIANPAQLAQEQADCRAYARERFDQREICDKLESFFLKHLQATRPDLREALSSARRALRTLPPVMLLGYIPADYRGGYRIRIEQEILALVRLGVRVHFACLHPPAEADALARHRASLEALGCVVHLVSCARFFDLAASAELFAEELKALGAAIDAHGIRLIQGEALYSTHFALLLKRQRPDLRLIYDAHGVTPEEERLGGAHPARIAATERWEREVLAESDLNVFVSEAMGDYYRNKYAAIRAPHVLVPCCVADERFPDPAAPSPSSLPPGRPILAYLGTMAAWQCGDEMIRLFAELSRRRPDFFFLLIVPGGDHAKTREKMRAHRLPDEAVLLVESPHDQVAAALQSADAGFLLRRRDPVNQVASPTKFGEYLAAGLPVIMSEAIGDFSALAAAEHAGLILDGAWMDAPAIPEATTARIADFIDAIRANREDFRKRCRNLAWEELHWEPAIERLAAACREVVLRD